MYSSVDICTHNSWALLRSFCRRTSSRSLWITKSDFEIRSSPDSGAGAGTAAGAITAAGAFSATFASPGVIEASDIESDFQVTEHPALFASSLAYSMLWDNFSAALTFDVESGFAPDEDGPSSGACGRFLSWLPTPPRLSAAASATFASSAALASSVTLASF
eukprot:scaffold125073_cov36-Phaeocystis_antarctica.AAC.1